MVLNIVWIGFMLIGLLAAVWQLSQGRTDIFTKVLTGLFDTARTGVDISLGLIGVMSLWLGLMKIGEQAGVIQLFARAFAPFFRRLFPAIPPGHPASGSIVMNFSANMLGLDNARSLLGAQGHFQPDVAVQLQPGDSPDDSVPAVRVQVTPGPQATVASVNLYTPVAAQQAAIQSQWTLPTGQPFTQAGWEQAKSDTLRQLTQRLHPAARIVGSLADVDAEHHQVHLHLELDPGPAFTLGPVMLEGLNRYEPDWVTRLLALDGVQPGAAYDLSQLQAAQQRLAQSGYFDSVSVHVDPNDPADSAPIRVQVREKPARKWVLGVGASTDSGPRLSAEHTHLRLPGLDAKLATQIKLERHTRTGGLALAMPVDAQGGFWGVNGQIEHRVANGTQTRNRQLQIAYTREAPRVERRWWLQWDESAVQPDPLPPGSAAAPPDRALSLNQRWHLRDWAPLPFPTAGHGLTLEWGAGWVTQPRRAPFGRVHARWQGLKPLSTAADGRLAIRLEGGAVFAALDTPVPEAQLFLTGGDQSVRGYAVRSIGIPGADGTLRGGRVVAAGSLEWQRPWPDAQGRPGPWESALFVDGGAVARQVSDLKAHWGVGAGIRYRTPVGPIQADLAYGAQVRRWRLHITLGMVF